MGNGNSIRARRRAIGRRRIEAKRRKIFIAAYMEERAKIIKEVSYTMGLFNYVQNKIRESLILDMFINDTTMQQKIKEARL